MSGLFVCVSVCVKKKNYKFRCKIQDFVLETVLLEISLV